MNKYVNSGFIFFFILNLLYSALAKALTINTGDIFQATLLPQTSIPNYYKTYAVNNVKQVYQALNTIKNDQGYSAIIFNEGVYHLKHTLNITSPNLMFLSKSADPSNTILRGNGMKPTKGVDNLLYIAAPNFIIDGLTLEQAGNHLIQIAGEKGARKPIIRNAILQDSYEQLIKVTYSKKHRDKFSNEGVIENNLFRYTKGVGPNYYIGGIDAHGIRNWVIQNNIFENIASPSKYMAEHAIHLWNDTFNNVVKNNLIINSDRGIGFGMRMQNPNYIYHSNFGGVIEDNIIYHENNNNKFSDVGVILEGSPNTMIENNIIFLEHNYPNAIEYRFEQSTNIVIKNNTTNKDIQQRNGAQASVKKNNVIKLRDVDIIKAINKFKELNFIK
ncbi:right-handed parallel beta-helix repeat-containing protein [Colwellia sp. E2M01]|uniref:right-handed parallel beta-helix repeat-containing protein n=1 Tax=Colwellia sp. E2M01 TaxID=2841561 RepID=UPI001C096F5C|nr:right-handed parallel beta-helix repeat-containing protein [Colwellia sp. E2M01]MBU2869086.1 right-handed parallel beta-helix repeat-containing protein [Colwellia sp. E2M01]